MEGGADKGSTIRQKAVHILDLLHNPHKLETERKSAAEYRHKFYPSSGYVGSGGGSIGSSSYTPSRQEGTKTYQPYSSSDVPASSSSIASPSEQPGSTYNITNNNNINYNYGSNITAIQSENSNSFEKKRAEANQGYFGSVTSAISSSKYLQDASKMMEKSAMLQNANDTLKRTVGVDIRKAIGGKTAAEIAEARLKSDTDLNRFGGGRG